MARLKLNHWDSVIADCETCLSLSPNNMKAHYYLAQAQLSLRDYDAALSNALEAHRLCAANNDKSLAAVTSIVLRCKKERWADREKKRLREERELEDRMMDLLRKDRDEMLAAVAPDDEAEKKAVEEEAEQRMTVLRNVFEAAREQNQNKREVPEWAIDDISFNVMVDPVITKTGKSYERASIMEHLRRHPSDPLTRDPLTPADLRPNLALRQACEEFLEKNGWAADW